MLQFGLIGGVGSLPAPYACRPIFPEMISNSLFDCGLDNWQVYAGTTGTLVDNADGTVTLTASDAYASLEPIAFPATNDTDLYALTTSITALTGLAKISVMIDTTWGSTSFSEIGTYRHEFRGNMTEMVVGADADATAVITYDLFSCEKVVGPGMVTDLALTPGDTTLTMNWTAPEDNGSPILSYDLFLDGVWFGEVPPEQLTAEMTSLNNGQVYSMDVRAVNANGQANPTNKVTGTPSAIAEVVTFDGSEVTFDGEAVTWQI
jgi:hypothetical protein